MKDLTDYCARLNIQVIPEIDMPGHSQPFAKAMKTGMQTEKGISILKDVVDETVALFPGRFFHMGSDEVHITMKDFIPAHGGVYPREGQGGDRVVAGWPAR